MNILAAIRREKRKLEKQAQKLQKQLDGLRAAANALGDSATDGAGRMQKRIMSAAARAKISKAARRRWAKVKAGARKAAS
jgi:predicted transcriptional regulator